MALGATFGTWSISQLCRELHFWCHPFIFLNIVLIMKKETAFPYEKEQIFKNECQESHFGSFFLSMRCVIPVTAVRSKSGTHLHGERGCFFRWRHGPWIPTKRGCSGKKGYKIRAEVHGKGGILSTSRLAYVPLLDWTSVTRCVIYHVYVWYLQK